jgi:hypothetical protein
MSPTFIAGHDGRPIGFETVAEADAYRAAQRAAEPPWLQRLRQRHSEVCRMHREAYFASMGRGGHKAVLSDIENGLRDLCSAMVDDIKEAARELPEVNNK